jgi:hypothetical protein
MLLLFFLIAAASAKITVSEPSITLAIYDATGTNSYGFSIVGFLGTFFCPIIVQHDSTLAGYHFWGQMATGSPWTAGSITIDTYRNSTLVHTYARAFNGTPAIVTTTPWGVTLDGAIPASVIPMNVVVQTYDVISFRLRTVGVVGDIYPSLMPIFTVAV